MSRKTTFYCVLCGENTIINRKGHLRKNHNTRKTFGPLREGGIMDSCFLETFTNNRGVLLTNHNLEA